MLTALPAPAPDTIRAFFSCRPFDPEAAAAVAVGDFGGTPRVRVLQR